MYVCELVCVCMCVYVYRYCPSCKTDSSEVIAAGEKMRITKKKANIMFKKHECNRDWGKVCGSLILMLIIGRVKQAPHWAVQSRF